MLFSDSFSSWNHCRKLAGCTSIQIDIHVVQKYCVDDMDTPESIFACLRRNKEEENFDRKCRKMIILREELRAQGLLLIHVIDNFTAYRGL